jgi:AcrR family transcriptional regulator
MPEKRAAVPETTASPRILRRRERMRAALVAAASRQFAARGVGAVSVEELIAEADVSRATFYRFFSSKYNLLEDILNPIFKDAVALIDRQMAEAPLAALEGLIDAYWQLWERHRDGMLLIPVVSPEAFRHFSRQHAALNDAMLRLLQKAERADVLRNGSAQYSLKVIARTAIPLLRVYDGHPAAEGMFGDALRGLLIRAH